jgi:hypothetical protein
MNQQKQREAIGKALHKQNKKRYQWSAIRKDEGLSFEGLTKETRVANEAEEVNLEPKEKEPA